MDEQDLKMIREDHDKIRDIHAVILGVNGEGGCFRAHTKAIKDFYKFKRNCLIVCAFLLGSGALGITVFEVAKLLSG